MKIKYRRALCTVIVLAFRDSERATWVVRDGCGENKISGRGVTANILALGASDSGFESRRPD